MPIKLHKESGERTLVVQVSGTLVKADYEQFVPEFDNLARLHGKLHVLFDLTDIHGWDLGALREDINFGMDHIFAMDRLAIVGDKKWEEVMSFFCKMCTAATVRYFDHADVAGARKWLEAESSEPATGKVE